MLLGFRQMLKTFLHRFFLPICYRVLVLFYPRVKQGLVLFADAHSDTIPPSMELVVQKAVSEGCQVEGHFLDFGRASFGKILCAMLAFLHSYAQAEAVFLCSYYLPASSVSKRPETKLIQLWHACGVLKKFGFDTCEDIPKGFHGNPAKGYDLVTVTSAACVPFYAGAFHLPDGVCRALGVSRTDRYFEKGWRENYQKKLLERHPELQGKNFALWAPTFRGNAAEPITEGLASMSRLDLGEGWKLLTKLHPNIRQREGLFEPGLSTEELLPSVQVLVTDYSTVLFEAALLGIPIVLYLPDGREYEKSRGLYIPLEEIPARIVYDEEELAGAVRRAREEFDPEKNKRFVEKYLSACDGKATERIWDAVFH